MHVDGWLCRKGSRKGAIELGASSLGDGVKLKFERRSRGGMRTREGELAAANAFTVKLGNV